MKKILCLGSATKDIFVSLTETRILDNPGEIQAQKLMAFEFGAKEYAENLKEEVGGSAVNISAGLTLLEKKAFLLSRVDRSDLGDWILKKVGKMKIKKNYVQKTGGKNSEVSVILSDKKNGDHIIFRSGDSTDDFDFGKFQKKFKEKADWLLVASQKEKWFLKKNQILDFVEKRKIKLAFNPSSFQIGKAEETLRDFLPKVKIIFLNKDEAIEILLRIKGEKIETTSEILQEMLTLGVENVVLTDGANGGYVGNKNEKYFLPAKKKVYNAETVGAGDAFCCGFLASYSQEENLKKALTWGIANSSSVVKEVGATKGLLKIKQIKLLGKELEKDIQKI